MDTRRLGRVHGGTEGRAGVAPPRMRKCHGIPWPRCWTARSPEPFRGTPRSWMAEGRPHGRTGCGLARGSRNGVEDGHAVCRKKSYRFATRRVKTIPTNADYGLRKISMSSRGAQVACFLLLILLAAALPASDSRYTVKEGETLFAVAKRAQVPVDVLSEYNSVADAAKVRTGTVLRIPTAYTVKRGHAVRDSACLQRAGGPPARAKLPQNARLKIGNGSSFPWTRTRLSAETPTPSRRRCVQS